jgi:hypothetical protein
MATHLNGDNTYFLPFNKGTKEQGAGNDVPNGSGLLVSGSFGRRVFLYCAMAFCTACLNSDLSANKAELEATGKQAKKWRIDLVLFINGFPVATLELKSHRKAINKQH